MASKEAKITRRRLRSSYMTSVISIALVLFLLGILGLLVLNAKRVSEYVKENIGFSIMLKEDVKEVDVIRLQKMLDAKEYVKSTKYVTQEEAAGELKEELGEDFVSFLGYNPLLASIDVHLNASYANPESIEQIKNDLRKYEQIKEVFYQKSLVELINQNIRKISLIILVFSGLLFLVAVALIHNTIRLSIYSKRFIINTMQLVGATKGFIRRPFIFTGVMQGVYASILSIALLTGLVYLIQDEFTEIISLEDYRILALLYGMVMFVGVVISWISTFKAVNKYLKIKVDKLYY
ncbi:MAG TPA: permease-like cell division protein FtsX [Bacteroidales bacterium]|nr:permease-like cell division protein FtsX [Bacteroidales bacterium]